MRTVKRILSPVLLVLLLWGTAGAITPDEIIDIRTYSGTDNIAAGSDFRLAVEMRLLKDWHINSNTPTNEFAIPTEVIFKELPGITITRIIYPPAKVEVIPKANLTIDYYDGSSAILVEGRAAENLAPGRHALHGTFSYQGCRGKECLLPGTKEIVFDLTIVPHGTPVKQVNARIFSPSGEHPSAAASGAADVSRIVAEKGLLLSFVLIFLGGLALNLTPCVYPLIPITISYFGGMEQKGKRFWSASAYVLGIAITYSALGTFAALSGEMLGKQLTNPIVTIVLAGILVALSMSMFGLFEVSVPRFLMNLVGSEAKKGVAGSLFMGCTMGIIAAPCIGPFILGLMTYVAKLGDPFMGFLLFFVLAIGMGLPYLFLGIFSGAITSLPRSGEWLLGVRRIFGVVLIVMAVYVLDPVLSDTVFALLFSLALVAGGFWLIVIDRSGEKNRGFQIIKSLVAIAMIIGGTWLYRPEAKTGPSLSWQPYAEELLTQAREAGKPVIIDFFADWCVPCKELDTVTFKDPRVVRYSGRFIFLKADLTRDSGEFASALKKKFDIRGVPTIVFLRQDGTEETSLRLTGFEGPEDFVKRLEKIASPR